MAECEIDIGLDCTYREHQVEHACWRQVVLRCQRDMNKHQRRGA